MNVLELKKHVEGTLEAQGYAISVYDVRKRRTLKPGAKVILMERHINYGGKTVIDVEYEPLDTGVAPLRMLQLFMPILKRTYGKTHSIELKMENTRTPYLAMVPK